MADDAIVAFIDILGYEAIVQKKINDSDFIKRFDDMMYSITVGCKNQLLISMKRPELTTQEVSYLERVVDSVKVRFIYDNVIFSLPLSELEFDSHENDEGISSIDCIELFFSSIALFSTFFIGKMGTLLRGGISIGSHYESERDRYLFIFSDAHNNAVRLESDAKYPRILLDDTLRSYLDTISYPMGKYFFRDEDGRCCFDIYAAFDILGEELSLLTLTDIKKGITLNIESNCTNNAILDKLKYYAKYHNKKVKGLNFPDLSIAIKKEPPMELMDAIRKRRTS